MKRQGIKFKLNTSTKAIKGVAYGLTVTFDGAETETNITSEEILIAIGRKLNLNLIPDIETLGLKLNGKAIAVNEFMETSVPSVYAVGDVIGGRLLAHLAFAEGKAAVENACSVNTRVDYKVVPSCVYTHP